MTTLWWRRMALAAALVLGLVRLGMAQPVMEQGLLCRSAIRLAESGSTLPATLLNGIARVESGRRDPVTGRVSPWPWTINAEGKGSFFDTKAEAVAFARQLRARGVESFDTGCLQVNLMHHPNAFATLDDAFDPLTNARYAVKFLTELRDKTGSWESASAWYHSANPDYGVPYRAQVVTAMAEEVKGGNAYIGLPELGRTGGLDLPALSGMSARQGALSSMPTRQGTMIMLARSSAGGGPAGQGQVGRGLDAYRAQPVRIAAIGMMAAR